MLKNNTYMCGICRNTRNECTCTSTEIATPIKDMIPSDEVTFSESLNPYCISCGSKKIIEGSDPFWVDGLLVAPLHCTDCGYGFSMNISLSSVVKEMNSQS